MDSFITPDQSNSSKMLVQSPYCRHVAVAPTQVGPEFLDKAKCWNETLHKGRDARDGRTTRPP